MTAERTIAGHRVLRLLAQGSRSQVWLAAGDVVLKVLAPPVPDADAGREAEALHRARGEHVVELLDVSLGADGAVLVFPRLPRGSLAEVLARRRSLDAGEAVTILAPIATCLTRLHGAGVAHGALTPDAVLFRADGAPTLTGFGRAELFEPGIPEVERERIAGVTADREALRGLADAVLSRASGARGKAASRLRGDLHDLEPGELAERMTSSLFELAAARPVGFESDDERPAGPAGRVVDVAEPQVAEPEAEPHGRLPAIAARLLESGPASLVRDAATQRWAGWSLRRRRAVLAAGAAGAVLLLALVALPSPGPPGVHPAAAPEDAMPGIAPEPDGPEPDGTESDGTESDDPLEALRELAGRRDGCFRELSVLCLDGVDEAGSSAWDADRAAIQAILDGGDAPPRLSLTAAALVERIGDSALIDLGPDSDPASVLLLKGEAGWRIRDYLGQPSTGTEGG